LTQFSCNGFLARLALLGGLLLGSCMDNQMWPWQKLKIAIGDNNLLQSLISIHGQTNIPKNIAGLENYVFSIYICLS
jgi:hypothetical protein